MSVNSTVSNFQGTCAPFIYWADCPTKSRDAFILYSRIWVGLFAFAWLAVLASFLRRVLLVQERFNTLRLILLKMLIGIPLTIALDSIRSAGAKAYNVPPYLTSFLWIMGYVPPISSLILLTITWMTFSAKSMMTRPPITGNWGIYLSLVVPYFVCSLACSIACGISHKAYVISMTVLLASWGVMFFALFALCAWYGRKTISRLTASNDRFNKNQQLRAYVFMLVVLFGCSVFLIVDAGLLEKIDKSLPGFLVVYSFYRVNSWFYYVGGALYAWIATTHWLAHPPSSSGRGTSKSAFSGATSPRTEYTNEIAATPSPSINPNGSSEKGSDASAKSSSEDAS